jgi:uncharacterized phage protein (TIGR02218 family)
VSGVEVVTTVCRAWVLERRDGVRLGFTDHDRDLVVDGVTCAASSGMTAGALQLGTGLAVDNMGAQGALRDDAIREEDIAAGRWDAAAVTIWRVDWTSPGDAVALFRGALGEITRGDGAFQAELRGLSEALNRVRGRVFAPQCDAVLGDARCRADMSAPGRRVEGVVDGVTMGGRVLRIAGLGARDAGWFEHGLVRVLDGAAGGLEGRVKVDRAAAEPRELELWVALGATVAVGDRVRVEAGCDRRIATCRAKFGNVRNFRGFPHIPGDDWLLAYPVPGRGR